MREQAAGSASTGQARRRAAEHLLEGLDQPRILSAMSPQQPDELLSALVDVGLSRNTPMTVLVADLEGTFSFIGARETEAMRNGLLTVVTLAGAVPRRLGALVDHVPRTLWDIDRMLADGTIPVDIVVARVHETQDSGTFSFGRMVGYTPSALLAAARVALEVAPKVDAPPGPSIPRTRADVLVVDPGYSPPEPAAARPTRPLAETIGRLVAEMIPRGATLQLGLGVVPDAVVPALGRRVDLSFHSGILPASVADALASGMLGGPDTTTVHTHVATGVMSWPSGTPRWAGQVTLRPVSVTHAPGVLAGIERLWAVNSAFEVDLNGQVNAEYAAGVRVASAGGQVDFFQGAHVSPGGASVLVLPSRTQDGRGRIRATLDAPHIVTTPGSLLDVVVTEFGVARLTGLSATGRAEALISVAHPDDRAALNAARSA